MIKQLLFDIKWKYLIISIILTFCILLLAGSILASIKGKAFIYWFTNWNTQSTEINKIQDLGNNFVNSKYWAPLHLATALIAQSISCMYLVKNAKGVEIR